MRQYIIIKFFRSIAGKYYEVELTGTTSAKNSIQMNNTFQQHQLTEGSYSIYYISSLVFLVALLVLTGICILIKKRRFSYSNNDIELTNRTALNNRE